MTRGRVDGDPIGSEKPRGKSSFRRKSGRDPGFTPTELHQKAQLMRQFMKNPEGTPNTVAYRSSPAWCTEPGCHRLRDTHTHEDSK